jgi:hypothetical protein
MSIQNALSMLPRGWVVSDDTTSNTMVLTREPQCVIIDSAAIEVIHPRVLAACLRQPFGLIGIFVFHCFGFAERLEHISFRSAAPSPMRPLKLWPKLQKGLSYQQKAIDFAVFSADLTAIDLEVIDVYRATMSKVMGIPPEFLPSGTPGYRFPMRAFQESAGLAEHQLMDLSVADGQLDTTPEKAGYNHVLPTASTIGLSSSPLPWWMANLKIHKP